MPVSENDFETLAGETLDDLMEQIDAALGDQLDVDLEGGILTIELANGGQYVINKQAPNKEIWVSSPLSGAHHFTWEVGNSAWKDTRSGESLYDMLSQEMSQVSGGAFRLNG